MKRQKKIKTAKTKKNVLRCVFIRDMLFNQKSPVQQVSSFIEKLSYKLIRLQRWEARGWVGITGSFNIQVSTGSATFKKSQQ